MYALMTPVLSATGASDVISAILAIFSVIANWFVEELPKLTAIFWVAESGLTFFGVLAIAGLAFSVIFLLFKVVQNFLHFRG